MHKNASGSLWRVELADWRAAHAWPRGLAFPYGVGWRMRKTGGIVFSESWRHRLASVPQQGGKAETVLPTTCRAIPPHLARPAGGYLAGAVRAAQPDSSNSCCARTAYRAA